MTEANDKDIPAGYTYTPSSSAFVNHVGRSYHKRVTNSEGVEESWVALRIEQIHVNTWGLAHGGLMAVLAEMGSSGPAFVPGGPPVVVIDMTVQFIRAPKLGELIEVCGTATRRTRSLVFTYAKALIGKDVAFTATAVHKIVGS